MIILVFKQVFMNVYEYVEDKYGTGKRVKAVAESFEERIKLEKDPIKKLDHEMHS